MNIKRMVLRNNTWVDNDTARIITRCKGLRVLDLSSGKAVPHLPSLKGRVLQLNANVAYFVNDEQAYQMPMSEIEMRFGGRPTPAQLRVFMNAHWNDKGLFLEESRRRHALRVESRFAKGMHCIAWGGVH